MMRVASSLGICVCAGLLLVACDNDGGSGGSSDAGPTFDITLPDNACAYDAQCADAVGALAPCERAVCNAGTCEKALRPTGAYCDAQGAGECERGACSGDGVCIVVTAPDGFACKAGDWNACFGFTCQEGACQPVATKVCDDANACTTDTCDPATGACAHAPATGPCDDLNPCTAGDVCTDGACEGPDNVCQCLVDADCVPFDDGDKCNGVLACDGGVCVPKANSAVTCADEPDPCLENVCKPATGACVVQAVANGTACDDGEVCTGGDACQAGVCVGPTDACACSDDDACMKFDDGDACNGVWTCQGGGCAFDPATVVDCGLQEAPVCNALVCVPATGTCAPQPLADGGACDDGDPCTADDACSAGACVGGTDLCACAVDADCEGLDDGDKCNGVWTCDTGAGKCVEDATPVDCSGTAVGACEEAACVPETGACEVQPVADGAACDDGDPCTGDDACTAGACVGPTDLCACAVDADCESLDDGNLCNGAWTCDTGAGKCVEDATPVDCSGTAVGACEIAVCVPATGACEPEPAADGTACDDGQVCTEGETCTGGACGSATSVTCEYVCDDAIDDDDNGSTDCDDTACASDAACVK